MANLWTPDHLTPLLSDDAGAACDECGAPATWYDPQPGEYLCPDCVNCAVEAIEAIYKALFTEVINE